MKAESILKSDILDIIFKNRNKDYGAYQLRKYYPNRLKKSIGLTVLLVVVFAGLQSWKTPKKIVEIEVSPVIDLDNFLQKKKEIEKPKEQEKHQQAIKKQVAEVPFTPPIITIDPLVKNTIPENAAVDTSFIGNKFNPNGGKDSGFVGITPSDSKIKDVFVQTDGGDPIDESPIFDPSVMPEFPGGLAALKSFMLKNLRQPDDIDEGQKFVVLAQFVVDKQGNISAVHILKNGRDDLDEEVMRVINMMPKWKPASENGYHVAVYYKMPITFVNNN
ncbi:MAG: energy transducer TonB [Chitinophagaceae bacterium]